MFKRIASAQYRTDFYKNRFSYKHFIQKLWCHLLTETLAHAHSRIHACMHYIHVFIAHAQISNEQKLVVPLPDQPEWVLWP